MGVPRYQMKYQEKHVLVGKVKHMGKFDEEEEFGFAENVINPRELVMQRGGALVQEQIVQPVVRPAVVEEIITPGTIGYGGAYGRPAVVEEIITPGTVAYGGAVGRPRIIGGGGVAAAAGGYA